MHEAEVPGGSGLRGGGVIAVVGEALVDLVGEGRVFRAAPGGSPFNVAVGLARLGVRAALLARLSQDSFGAQLREHLERNGVSLDLAVSAVEPTTLAIAMLDPEGSASYEFYIQGTADWQWRHDELPDPLPPDVVAIHAGSLAMALDPGARVLEEFLRREHARGAVTISLDPNIRPHLALDHETALRRVEEQIAYAHLVKASADDIRWLYPNEPLLDVLHRWHRHGPSLVVATLGGDGALALWGSQPLQVEATAPAIEVVDTVGAGDAFTSALLAGLDECGFLARLRRGEPGSAPEAGSLSGSASAPESASVSASTSASADASAGVIESILARACAAAALTCTRPGADPPTAAELSAR